MRVALCHCGSPWDQSTRGLALWRAAIAALADNPNVYCKISGFGMFDPHWTLASVRPLFDTVLAIFGPDRCMFGSNYPVEKLVTSYRRVWETYAALTVGYGAELRERLFAGTACEFYRLAGVATA
ncbi:MAG: amidohydrolase family protein [Steroidobacteraceae bacterium]|nr:amidohydrolase family protein [Steroidobacteraceae bacterium]MDW8260334.1 amidohydrolase family protein [Gammaproteobacteria bacterium]